MYRSPIQILKLLIASVLLSVATLGFASKDHTVVVKIYNFTQQELNLKGDHSSYFTTVKPAKLPKIPADSGKATEVKILFNTPGRMLRARFLIQSKDFHCVADFVARWQTASRPGFPGQRYQVPKGNAITSTMPGTKCTISVSSDPDNPKESLVVIQVSKPMN